MNIISIPSPNYHPGRIRPVRLIVLHTAECPCEPGRAEAVASFLARPSTKASAHWCVGPDVLVAQVAEDDTAWAAPGANADGVQVEQTAYAGWSAEWTTGPLVQAMLRNTAQLLVDISRRTGIPLVALTNAELAAGKSGVVTHVQASEVYRQSDHWDCGPNYPVDRVIVWAREMAGGGTVTPGQPTTPTTTQEDDEIMRQYRDVSTGTVYAQWGGFKTPLESDGVRQAWMQMGILLPPDRFFEQSPQVLAELETIDQGDLAAIQAGVDSANGSISTLLDRLGPLADAIAEAVVARAGALGVAAGPADLDGIRRVVRDELASLVLKAAA